MGYVQTMVPAGAAVHEIDEMRDHHGAKRHLPLEAYLVHMHPIKRLYDLFMIGFRSEADLSLHASSVARIAVEHHCGRA